MIDVQSAIDDMHFIVDRFIHDETVKEEVANV